MAEPKIKYDLQLRGRQILRNQAYVFVELWAHRIGNLQNSGSWWGWKYQCCLVDALSVGKSKAKTVCVFLQELNDAVKAKFIEEYPEALIDSNPSFFSQFTLVIATQLVEDSMMKLDRICRDANVMLIFARSYSLSGFVQISVKEHAAIESKLDHFLDELRLNNPWLELKSFAESIELGTVDPVFHKHTPHVIILIKMEEEWAKTHDGDLPSTREEKKKIKDLINSKMIATDEDSYKEAVEASFKVFAPQGISLSVQQIINDRADVNSNSSDFCVLVAALKEFIANEGGGEAPLEGSIPDMTSSSELYINLQRIYQAKAEADFLVMEQHVRKILKKIGRDTDSISKATIKRFCKNARKLKVSRYRPIEDEFNSPVQVELHKYLTHEDYRIAMGFYVLLRVVDRLLQITIVFRANMMSKNLKPEMDEEISRLETTAVALVSDLGCNGSTLHELV